MRRILLTAPLVILIFGGFSVPSASAAQLSDPYIPIIKSLKVDYRISVIQNSGGSKNFALYADIALAVRVHVNSLSGFTLSLRPVTTMKSAFGCQNVIPAIMGSDVFRLDVGKTSGLTSTSPLPVLKNLVGSKKDGDWLLQGYEFQLLLRDDFKLPPCLTDFKVNYIYLIDEALHEKSILFGYGSSPIYEMFTQPSNMATRKLLPENACPVGDSIEFAGSLSACQENSSISAIQVGFTQSEIDAALKTAGIPSGNTSNNSQGMQQRLIEIEDRIKFLEGSIKSANTAIQSYTLKMAGYRKSLAQAADENTKAYWMAVINSVTDSFKKLDSAVANAKKEIVDLTAERKVLLGVISSASPTPSSSPKPSSTAKKFGSVQCQKGKEVKKFMGYNPVCPKGYTLLK